MTDERHRRSRATRLLRRSSLAQASKRTLTELVDRRVAAATGDLTTLRDEVSGLRERVWSLELLLDGDGRGMARLPRRRHLATLQDEIAELCGDSAIASRDVHVAFRLLAAMEALGVGRIAGGTMNICGKLATIPLLAPEPDETGTALEILEIGTLYGLFAASLLRMTERRGTAPSLTIVDPLVGTQLQNESSLATDPSGTPVTEAAVRTNLALAGAAGAAARLVVGFSGDPAIRERAGDRQYGVVVVDGDHGYDGVAADLQWVEQLVAPGGLVVLDDYGDKRWPGVKQALDDHLTRPSRLTLLGRAATSGFLRAR